jgi:hypothetical protein
MIVHSVFFRLHHASGSEDESAFFEKADVLRLIPGVENFKVLKEFSPKNPFTFGFSVDFSNQAAYDFYSNHAAHLLFVDEVWVKEVAEFQEIDSIIRHD